MSSVGSLGDNITTNKLSAEHNKNTRLTVNYRIGYGNHHFLHGIWCYQVINNESSSPNMSGSAFNNKSWEERGNKVINCHGFFPKIEMRRHIDGSNSGLINNNYKREAIRDFQQSDAWTRRCLEES